MFKIEVHKEALSFLNSLDTNLRSLIVKKLEELKNNPYPQGVVRLKGYQTPTFRIRIGKYRALYFVSGQNLTIYIIKVDKRSTVYD